MKNFQNIFNNSFPAMNTLVEYGIRSGKNNLTEFDKELRIIVENFEKRFSRFLPDSELSLVNRQAGQEVFVSPVMSELLSAAENAYQITKGIVDPTIGRALAQSGYNRSFEQINKLKSFSGSKHIKSDDFSFADVSFSIDKNTVNIPLGVSLDFGGIGKGFLLQKLTHFFEKYNKNFWISLGGDIVVSGGPKNQQTWPIAVQNSLDQKNDIGVIIPSKGHWSIATSGITKRQWIRNGVSWHHLIDPRTQQPAKTDLTSVTVITKDSLMADVLAKYLLINGSKNLISLAGQYEDTEAVGIDGQGRLCKTPGMSKILQLC